MEIQAGHKTHNQARSKNRDPSQGLAGGSAAGGRRQAPTPNGPGSLLEKRVFDPFFTHFCSQNGPFSRHIGFFHGSKRVTTGSKRAKITCLCIPNGPGSLLEKCVFDPFLTHFGSQNSPFSRHFGIFHGPKRVNTELGFGPTNGWVALSKHFGGYPDSAPTGRVALPG